MPGNGNKIASERPPDSDFQQQNLKAWQPLLTPGWVIATFFFVGVVFIPIGAVVLDASEQVVEIEKNYEESGVYNFDIPKDMKAPIFFYYKLTNFYQNHRRYVKSKDDKQLAGEMDTLSTLDTKCEPLSKYNGKYLYPCGLIANSYFNDTFSVSGSGTTWDQNGIAWPSDLLKYKSPGQTYNTSDFTDIGPMGYRINVTDEAFMVWMRTAGLPTFKKLRYIIRNNLKKGDTITVTVASNFPVKSFGGTKAMVLSTTSWLGGKNDFLGYAYIVVGALCVLLALAFFVKHKVSPRPLGDMRYFNWSASSKNEAQQ